MEWDLRKIKELMAAMGRSGITEVSLKEGDFELGLKRGSSSPPVMMNPIPMVPPAQAAAPLPTPAAAPAGADAADKAPAKEEKPGTFVTSPMVGTFYSSPEPGAEAFVKTGDRVTEDTVVCIVEAMKVMNEVKAGKAGVLAECLLADGQPVEFGSKLFRVD